MVSPNEAVWWIPVAGLTTPSAPKATEINAGTRISAALEAGYTLKFSDSSVDNSQTVEDEGVVDTPSLTNYEGKMSFFNDDIGTGTQDAPVPSTAFTTVNALFATPYVEGWLVSRYGRKASVAAAAGHIVSVFRFKNEYPRIITGDAEKPIRTEVDFLPQGEAYANVTCVA
jgi:hypothetical protein